MLRKLLAIVKRDRVALALVGFEQPHDSLGHRAAVPAIEPCRQRVARASFHQGHQRATVVFAYDGIALPVAYAALSLHNSWALPDADATLDLTSSLLATGIALFACLLAA